ncbi:EsaB/YukD family protein [Micropruina sp.]|uniref:EsaB/YukD family protein n=1 Tax=Micropruina sp. TaxID=2737536 RepID=UPI0039E3B74B
MSDYTRLTVQGTLNRADLVLPSDEPLAAMLPEILELLHEPAGAARPLTLVTVLGEQLNASLSLTEQNVRQGSIVRLVKLDEAPSPPEVADITQLAGESVPSRDDRWRRGWAVLAAAVAALVAGRLIGAQLPALGTGRWVALGAAAALALLAVVLARRGGHGAGAVTTAVAAGLAGPAAESFVTGQPSGAATGAWLGACGVLVLLVALLGYRDRGLALGAGSLVLLIGGWTALGLAGLPLLVGAGVMTLAGTLGIGLLPGLAMTASGLTALDDRVIEGGRVSRPDAAAAVAATHRGLNWACGAFALVSAAAGFVLATAGNGWGLGLAAAASVVLALRTRVLPLAPQRLALFAAALAIATGLARTGLTAAAGVTLAGLVLAAAVLVAITAARLSGNLVARLGRLGNALELLAVLVMVPLLLGLMGVFHDLLVAF